MGKFDSKNKGSQVNVYQLIAERNSSASSRQSSQPREAQPQQNIPQQYYPQQSQKSAPAEPRRRGPRVGSLIFYTFYFLLVFAILGGIYMGLGWVKDFLVKYEAGQPDVKREQIYNEYFADPDWARLYEEAGIQDTEYEGVEEYVAYMEAKQGDAELELMETSAGLSGDKKYILKLGDERWPPSP